MTPPVFVSISPDMPKTASGADYLCRSAHRPTHGRRWRGHAGTDEPGRSKSDPRRRRRSRGVNSYSEGESPVATWFSPQRPQLPPLLPRRARKRNDRRAMVSIENPPRQDRKRNYPDRPVGGNLFHVEPSHLLWAWCSGWAGRELSPTGLHLERYREWLLTEAVEAGGIGPNEAVGSTTGISVTHCFLPGDFETPRSRSRCRLRGWSTRDSARAS